MALGQNHLTFRNIYISRMENVIIIWLKYHCNFIPCNVFVRPTFFPYYNNILTFRTSFIKHSIFRILYPSDSKYPTIHQSYLLHFSQQFHQVELPIP